MNIHLNELNFTSVIKFEVFIKKKQEEEDEEEENPIRLIKAEISAGA